MENNKTALDTVFHALADPTRRAVIQKLGEGSATVSELSVPFDMALPSFMKHIGVLEASGLIGSKKIGRVRTCKIKPKKLSVAQSWLDEQRALWECGSDRLTRKLNQLGEIKMNKNNRSDLTVSRIIKAPRSSIWKAWKDPEQLVKWWAPAPFTTVSTKHEFYLGGGFGTIMRMEDGTDFFNAEACFLEVVENERIVWTSALQGGWRPNKGDMPFSAIVTLEEHPEGTKYTATALHQNDEDRQKHADMGFTDGWGTCIEQLGKIAEHLQ